MEKTIQGYVYLVYDQKTKKVYVGQKLGLPENSKNYYGSGLRIKRIIKKRGKSFLQKRILGVCYSKEELSICETECIRFYNAANNLYGLNILKIGGKTTGYSCYQSWIDTYGQEYADARWKKQCDDHSKQMKGKYTKENNPMYGKHHSEKSRLKMGKSGKNHANFGKPMSKETKNNISLAKTGTKATEEAKKNMSKSHIGLKATDKTKRNMSKAQKKSYANGRIPAMIGYEWSETQRKTLSDAKKGNKNGMYGKSVYSVWVEKYGTEEAEIRKKVRADKVRETLRLKKKIIKN